MLNHLLESRATRQRRPGGTIVSVVVHALLVAGLVSATAHATVPPIDDRTDVPLTFTDLTPPPKTPPPQPSAPTNAASPVSAGAPADMLAPSLVAPVDIPSVIPDIDFTRAPTNPDDFASGRRSQAGGVPGGTGNAPSGGAYFDWQVEKPVAVLPGSRGPQYPAMLREAGFEGVVVAQFVVDTLGRADLSTFQVLSSDHAVFTSAVKQALVGLRFLPAEVGQRKVSQVVQQAFQFRLNR